MLQLLYHMGILNENEVKRAEKVDVRKKIFNDIYGIQNAFRYKQVV